MKNSLSTACRTFANVALVLMTAITFQALADEANVPNFRRQPIFFAEQSGDSVTGQLLLGDINVRKAKFHLWAGGFGGGHMCSVSGQATSTDGKRYVFAKSNCRLSIRVEGNTAYVTDIGDYCSREGGYCGYRAGIGSMRLKAEPLSQSMYWNSSK